MLLGVGVVELTEKLVNAVGVVVFSVVIVLVDVLV